MQFDRDRIIKLGHLARLKVTAEEADRYAVELNDILHYVDKIAELDLRVAGCESESALPPYERPDHSKPSLVTALALDQAPEASGSSFKVPRIIES